MNFTRLFETIGDASLNPVYHRQIQLKEDDNELKKRVTSRMLTSKFDERGREIEYIVRDEMLLEAECILRIKRNAKVIIEIYIYITNVLLNEKAKARYY